MHLVHGGQPCQDIVRTWEGDTGHVLSIADGHGHPRYTHSDIGARIACEVTIELGRRLLDLFRMSGDRDPKELLAELAGDYKRDLAFEWNRRVKHDIAMRKRLAEGTIWREDIDGNWELGVRAYGTTCLSMVIGDDFAFWFQLGDGAMLRLDFMGNCEQLFGRVNKGESQATFSLAMQGCTDFMNLHLARRSDEPVALALLTTDGISDQYRDAERFYQDWGVALLGMIERRGWVPSIRDLPRRVGLMARTGDDCSLALLWHQRPLSNPLTKTQDTPLREE
ncbi:MAG: protein phosphatase 2C domain-containing protein [Proteobacteria bacterium]|nr:protein phosphatase 2C domain-containing protein [Pseudomonadota bacterium]MCP4915983.1 protein phosphatase 2C domain-containing protein [Pseudomonadota bacterium]